MGDVPSPAIGSLMEAILVSFIDHGATPPSTLAARNTATTGAPLRACVAAGVLGFGRYHGGDIESCMQFLDSGLELVRKGTSYQDAAAVIVARCRELGEPIPGFGHRFHTRDPRAARLFQMALELEVEGNHIQMMRAVEMVAGALPDGQAVPSTSTARSRPCAATSGFRRDRQRAVHHLARPRHRGAGARGAGTRAPDAPDRSEGPHLRRRRPAPPARQAAIAHCSGSVHGI